MQPKISSVATMCPIIRRSYSLNCDRLLRLNCTSPRIQNPRFLCCGIDTSRVKRKIFFCNFLKKSFFKVFQLYNYNKVVFKTHDFFATLLTKNDRLDCDAKLACHKLKLPSPSAMPNLLPCCENRHRVTLANVPGGRGVQTTC